VYAVRQNAREINGNRSVRGPRGGTLTPRVFGASGVPLPHLHGHDHAIEGQATTTITDNGRHHHDWFGRKVIVIRRTDGSLFPLEGNLIESLQARPNRQVCAALILR
jgi:hypothetical protein